MNHFFTGNYQQKYFPFPENSPTWADATLFLAVLHRVYLHPWLIQQVLLWSGQARLRGHEARRGQAARRHEGGRVLVGKKKANQVFAIEVIIGSSKWICRITFALLIALHCIGGSCFEDRKKLRRLFTKLIHYRLGATRAPMDCSSAGPMTRPRRWPGSWQPWRSCTLTLHNGANM